MRRRREPARGGGSDPLPVAGMAAAFAVAVAVGAVAVRDLSRPGVPTLGEFPELAAGSASSADGVDEAGYASELEAAAEPGFRDRIESLREALEHRRAGRDERALDALGRLARGPGLADWAVLLQADVEARRGDVEAVDGLVATLPAGLQRSRGWRSRSLARLGVGDVDGARELVVGALDHLDAGADSADAWLRLARVDLRAGDTAGARTALVATLLIPEARSAGSDAASTLAGLPRLGAEERAALVRHHLRRGEHEAAASQITSLARSGGVDPAHLTRLRLERAARFLDEGRPRDAEAALDRVGPGEEDPELRARTELLRARARLRGSGRGSPVGPLEAAAGIEPRGPAAQEALYILGDLDQDAGRDDRARVRFEAAVAVDPASTWGGEAAVRLGTLHYRDGGYLDAARVFEAYGAAHPEGWRAQQAAFWAGMAYRRLGEEALAAERFGRVQSVDPVGYYALRAGELGGAGAAPPELVPGPDVAEDVAGLARGAVARSAALASVGLPEAAAAEDRRARRFLAGRAGGLHALAEALLEAGRVPEAARLGRQVHREQGGWDRRLLAVVYPTAFRERIEAEGRRRELEPWLIASLARQESLFEPRAESPAGAVGLLQLLPRTARALALRAGLASVTVEDLRSPEVNLALGALHLQDLVRRFEGRTDEVLVAYNAGDGRLARWKRTPEARDPDLFLERIPYRETREYVRAVREGAGIYRALWTDG